MNRTLRSVLGLAVALLACYAAAAVGGLFAAAAVRDWYPTLAKPWWNPPAWVFGPVWTALYGMMAVAVWLVWLPSSGWAPARTGATGRRPMPAAAMILFGLQLAFNAAWSVVFFGLRRPDLAFADIVALWLALAATLWLFLRRRPIAGLLLLPYLLWVTFAAALNLAIWRLNA